MFLMASIMVNPFQNVFILLFPVHTRNHYLLATIVSQRYFLNNETWKLKLLLHAVFSSVQFSHSVVSDSLRPHELQHARPLCPSPTPTVHLNSCPSSQWCHPAISSSVIPFFSCPNPSQHQSHFQWVNSFHAVAKVLEFQLQHQSFQRTPRTDLL